jgi:excisionase family DNA binding protein
MRPRATTGTAFCSVREAAELLGVNQETVRRAIDRGELLAKRLGDRVLVSRHSILATDDVTRLRRTA